MSKGDPIYCVYEYLRPDTKECFYVGYGLKPRLQKWTWKIRNKAFRYVVEVLASKGLEPELIILEDNLTQNEAMEKEVERIGYWYKRKVVLTNNLNTQAMRKFWFKEEE